jgi:RasGEF domain/RasGEF N-terminal motif
MPSEAKQSPERVKTHYRTKSKLSATDSAGSLNSPVKKAQEPAASRKLAVDFPSSHVQSSHARSPSTLRSRPQTQISGTRLLPDDSSSSAEDEDSDDSSSPGSPHKLSVLRPDTADSQAHNTFLIMEDHPDDSLRESHHPPSLGVEEAVGSDPPRDETGSTFEELIDRLLALPMSKQDGKFVPVFLCLYRKFSSPRDVFSEITKRFDRVDHSPDPQLIKVGEQLRYLQVLALWTGDYPGDFAQSSVKKEALSFVSRLEKRRLFAYAAKEISNHLELVREDDDADWGRFDGLDELPEADASFLTSSVATSSTVRTEKSSTEELLKSPGQSSIEGSYEDLTRRSGPPSVGSGHAITSDMSSQSLAALLTRDETRLEAQTLISTPRTRLSKLQWHQFIEIPDEDIAEELTRMDWILYSSIRPRDLVRHVMLANEAKKTAKGLENVNRMIDHFNHLFCFVSGMILLRDKPKHRARMLEKWMTIAWKVRQLNNYNTLGSIIAGTNGTAVHRLSATWELVPEPIRKDYMRLTILMGTIRSHSAYRMAWENSFSERIPFIPVCRKDLVAAETGNRTFLGSEGNRINWKKFEIMGEIIISMQKSQDKPYRLRKNEEVLKLVLETQISQNDEVSDTKDESFVHSADLFPKDLAEELYERSLRVEPTGSGDTSRKKFDWLRR